MPIDERRTRSVKRPVTAIVATGVAAEDGESVLKLLLDGGGVGTAGVALEGGGEELGTDVGGAGYGAAYGGELKDLMDWKKGAGGGQMKAGGREGVKGKGGVNKIPSKEPIQAKTW